LAALRRWWGRRAAAVLAAANLAGVGLYLWRASAAWAIPAEREAGITTVTGEPFIWALAVAPVWGVFGVVNACWAFAALTSPSRRRDAWVLLALSAVWAVAVVVDFAHH
jgi:hypothetical protein